MGRPRQPLLFNPNELDYEPIIVTQRDGTVTYDPYFLEPALADEAFDALVEQTPWKQDEIRMYGRHIPVPRLTAWHGDPGASYSYSGIDNDPSPWTPPLLAIRERLGRQMGISFNSCLLNRYRNGQDSLSWHADDEPELGSLPVIASVSLGVRRTFQLQHRVDGEMISIGLDHGSLLVMSGLTQSYWKHQIPKERSVSGERLNLTFRVIDESAKRRAHSSPPSRKRTERSNRSRS
jgi:alkylated DNA repair dioxygenase AlkB